jgi:hypothetical protein
MIEVTEEMMTAYRRARSEMNQEQMHGRPPIGEDAKTRAGLEAVLGIVVRDLPDVGEVARRAYEQGQRDERALTELGF